MQLVHLFIRSFVHSFYPLPDAEGCFALGSGKTEALEGNHFQSSSHIKHPSVPGFPVLGFLARKITETPAHPRLYLQPSPCFLIPGSTPCCTPLNSAIPVVAFLVWALFRGSAIPGSLAHCFQPIQ